MKALVKKRGEACLPKEDSEDAVSAFISSLTWWIASTFFRDTPKKHPIIF